MKALTLPSPPPALSILLLGEFRIVAGTTVAEVSYHRARALLAYLIIEPGVHSRERLAELLWPDETDSATSRNNLRRMVFVLRKALGGDPSPLSGNRQTLRFDPDFPARVDIRRLQETASRCNSGCAGEPMPDCRALAQNFQSLYPGRFLESLDIPGADELMGWVQRRRAEFHRRALAYLERLSHCMEELGEDALALELAQRHVCLEPWDEAGYRRVMGILAAQGRIQEALDEYQRCRTMLEEELEVSPAPATRALAESLAHALVQNPRTPRLPTDPSPRSGPPAAPNPPASLRPLTALVCLADHGAQEEDGETVLAQLAAARETTLHQGAHVTVQGGGFAAYFGYPRADEHGLRRALQAALACAHPVLRLGLHTGIALSDPEANHPDALGALAQPAQRLADRAGPGEILVSPEARVQAADWAEFIELPPHPDGFRPLRLERLAHIPRRTLSRTPFIGRHGALATLRQAWYQCAGEQGGHVLVRAEPGQGKSRLLEQLTQEVDRCLICHCRPEARQAPFEPISEAIRALWGLKPEESAERLSHRLDQRLGPLADPHSGILAAYLSIPREPAAPAPPPDPALLREAWRACFAALTTSGPVLLVVEDVHWADPSTLALIDSLCQHPLPGLLVALTARPEFAPPWPAPCLLPLPPLPPPEAASLVAALAGEKLAGEAHHTILQRGDGNPLFLEELVALATSAPAALAAPVSSVGNTGVPDRLRALLAARLDGLGQEAGGEGLLVAQWGAVAGRQFDADLLGALLPGELVQRGLGSLLRAGLIHPQPGQTGVYQFKHALIQETAYLSLTGNQRRQRHRSLAQAWLRYQPGIGERQPEILAWHFSAAEADAEAIHYLLATGRQALARSAYQEAVQALEAARERIRRQAPGPERDHRELETLLLLGTPLAALYGYGSPEARRTYEDAMALSGAARETPAGFPLIWGLWLGSSSWSDFHLSEELARELVRLASQAGQPYLETHAAYALGNSLFCLGQPQAAIAALTAGMAHYPHDAPTPSPLGEDPGVTSLAFLSWAYWFVGDTGRAQEASRASIALARQVGHPHSLGYALIFAAMLQRFRRDHDQALAYAREAEELATTYHLALWEASAKAFRGRARALNGNPAGLGEMLAAVESVRKVMGGIEAMFLGLLLDAAEGCQAWEALLQTAQAGLQVVADKQDRHLEAEFLRGQGVATFHLGGTDALERSRSLLHQALAVAQGQGAYGLALRAALSLATLPGGDLTPLRTLRPAPNEEGGDGADDADGRLADQLLGHGLSHVQ